MSSSTVPHLLLHSLALTDPLVIAGGSPNLLLFLCGVGLGGGGSEQPLLLLISVFRPLAGKTIIPIQWGSSSCDTCTRLYAARPGTVGWAWMVTRMAWQLLGEQQIQHRKRCRISRGPRSRPKMDHLVFAVCGQACFPPPLHPCPTVVADSSPGVFWRREVTLRFPSHYLGTLHHKGREYK